MNAQVISEQIAELNRIASILSAVPGADGTGISEADRAAIFAFIDDGTWERWRAIVNVNVSRRHKMRVAVMRHCRIGMYTLPSADQVLSACEAAALNKIAP